MAKEKIQETTGGELTDYPNEHYKKFFEKFKEIDNIKTEEWKPVHLIGYFCKKYKEQYSSNYKFKFNNALPTKSFEVFQIKRLASMLSSKPDIIKSYIDWVYENKVIKAKRKLTSISFLTAEGVVNEYKLNYLLPNNTNISRSTILPEKYKFAFQEVGVTISTYGELAFLSQMNEQPFEIIGAFQKIEQLGFDKEILGRIV